MRLIGKGSFSDVYKTTKNKVIIYSSDPVKECMALGFFPDSRLFPKIEKLDIYKYKSTYYPKVGSLKKSLKPDQYERYKILRSLDRASGYDRCYSEFKKLPPPLKTPLLEALRGLSNYALDINFDIYPRNVAVTKSGNLVLLDCFYFESESSKRIYEPGYKDLKYYSGKPK